MNHKRIPSVAVIILNWNNWQDTVECLESLAQIDYPNYQVIVVDNGSTDDSIMQLKQRFDWIRLLETGENLGFSAGVNYGIERARDLELILLLNNDTIVAPNFLTELVKTIQSDNTIGLVGGKIYYLDAAKSDSVLYRQNKIWSAGGAINKLTKKAFHIGDKKIDHGQYDQQREVEFLSGCCLLIRREVIEKIGLLDPDYFMYYEDVDFCLRAKAHAYKIVYSPKAIIWHKIRQVARKQFADYYRMRNHFVLLKKRYSNAFVTRCLIGSCLLIERTGRILFRKFVYHDTEKISDRISALFDGFREGLIWPSS